jgi:hypothetical protein
LFRFPLGEREVLMAQGRGRWCLGVLLTGLLGCTPFSSASPGRGSDLEHEPASTAPAAVEVGTGLRPEVDASTAAPLLDAGVAPGDAGASLNLDAGAPSDAVASSDPAEPSKQGNGAACTRSSQCQSGCCYPYTYNGQDWSSFCSTETTVEVDGPSYGIRWDPQACSSQ